MPKQKIKRDGSTTRFRESEAVKSQSLIVTPESSIITEATEEEYHALGFLPRWLVQTTIPHSRPKDPTAIYRRSNGNLSIRIIPDEDLGVPYGTYPRLFLPWLIGETIRTESRNIELGYSFNDFLQKMDITKNGRTAATMRRQVQAFIDATIKIKVPIKARGLVGVRKTDFSPVHDSMLFWDPKKPNQTTLWKSFIRLSEGFFEEVIKSPIPIDLTILRAISKGGSPMAMDIYVWLNYRNATLKNQVTVPWEYLALQFGAEYKRTRDFRAKFKRQLIKVLIHYPTANVEVTEAGLHLKGGKPQVPLKTRRSNRYLP